MSDEFRTATEIVLTYHSSLITHHLLPHRPLPSFRLDDPPLFPREEQVAAHTLLDQAEQDGLRELLCGAVGADDVGIHARLRAGVPSIRLDHDLDEAGRHRDLDTPRLLQ